MQDADRIQKQSPCSFILLGTDFGTQPLTINYVSKRYVAMIRYSTEDVVNAVACYRFAHIV